MTRPGEPGGRGAAQASNLLHCLEGVLELALFITSADKGSVQVVDGDSGTLKIAVQSGFEQPFLQYFANVGTEDAAACGALHAGDRVIVPDLQSNALFAGTPALRVFLEAGVRAVQCTPLMSSTGKKLGVISTHFAQPHQPKLTARELQLLELLTRQAAEYLERESAAEALRVSEAALREADRRKDDFLAMLAHELRNPLAPIRAANELLSKILSSQDSRIAAALEITRRQVNQLARLLDDLLDVSRVTLGRFDLQCRPTEVPRIVAQALETVQPFMREKGHRLSVRMSDVPALYVSADPARLTQCVVNLLTNAAKYTDTRGEIDVSVAVQDGNAVIEVSDSGVGIAPELLPRIFDPFVQGEKLRGRTHGGLGVGLAIVKRLVEMHGGEVRAHSSGLGCGSMFQIRLPLIEQPRNLEPEIEAPRIATVSVLVVDDNEDCADSLAALLQLEGHEVQAVYSARDALERALTFKPDLLLLNIGLPEMDGYEVARKLREMPDLRGSHLIAVSGYGQIEDRVRAEAAGFDDHLVKPISLARLTATMLTVIAGQRFSAPMASIRTE